MKTVVKKGYVVFYNKMRLTEGMEVPSKILADVEKNQSWKIEKVKDGKEEKEASSSITGEAEEEKQEEKEIVLRDIVNDRAMAEEKVRKRGR
jgi:hypothetical protein